MTVQLIQAVKHGLANGTDILTGKICLCTVIFRKRYIILTQIHICRNLTDNHPAITHNKSLSSP